MPSLGSEMVEQKRGFMSQEKWTAVDNYIKEMLISSDPVLDEVLEVSKAAGLPMHNVSPTEGKLLMLLAQLQGARSILEIGTLGGYSTIWLARSLPADGCLITLEASPKHAEIARENIERAGLSERVELRQGQALDILPKLETERRGPFDMIFIDADKGNNPAYFQWALRLSKRGSLIVVDNVVRGGAVNEGSSNDPSVRGVRNFFELVAREPRVSATALQTVGIKGYDGMAIVLVTADP